MELRAINLSIRSVAHVHQAKMELSKYRKYEPEIILHNLRSYLRYSLDCRELEERIPELGAAGVDV